MLTTLHKIRIIALCGTLLLLGSCKKEEPLPTDPNAKPESVSVIRDGSSYAQDFSLVINVLGGQTIAGVFDFTVEPSNNFLHIVYYTQVMTQQGPIKSPYWAYYSLSDNSQGNTYTGLQMPKRDGYQANFEFMPYSQKLVAFNTNPFYPGAWQRAIWAGNGLQDLEMPWEPSAIGYAYTGGAGYRHLYSDIGWVKHYMNLIDNYNAAGGDKSPISSREYLSPEHNSSTLVSFPEPRDAGESPVIITINASKIVAYKFEYADSGMVATSYTKTGELPTNGYAGVGPLQTQRHYSVDGKKLAMMVRDDYQKKYWTYTYDLTSNTLNVVMENVDLPYSGEGSDLDMDDNGNIYYTGVSANGVGAGVSVYKRSASGTTLVGTDDFLKFGTVADLKYLNGKVHMVVTGNITGTDFWAQICHLVQQ